MVGARARLNNERSQFAPASRPLLARIFYLDMADFRHVPEI